MPAVADMCSRSTCQGPPVHSAAATPEPIRQHAQLLLTSIGVSRIIVVDDKYDEPEVETLLGICSTLEPEQLSALPYLAGVDFGADREIWIGVVRDTWTVLDDTARRALLSHAHAHARAPAAALTPPAGDTAVDHTQEQVDARAAESLEKILDGLEDCEYVTLSLSQWRARAAALLTDDSAAKTVLLFDKDFSTEQAGGENAGMGLVRDVQDSNVGYCGLMSHTVHVGGEYDAWRQLADEYDLDRDRFIVIAKERLTDASPDHYEFLRMLRFVALTGRYANVKSAAWSVFEQSVAEARAAVERLSVLDFDRIVFGSSRREGVWEPDTLFRVFGILMRREARSRLHQAEDISTAVTAARRISAIPEELATALGEEKASHEALRIQRFEVYEFPDELNRFHFPIEIGDIFEKTSTGRRYILLAQPCDLMVRPRGMRSYEDYKHGRTAALAELVVASDKERARDSWAELSFYNEDAGQTAFVDFAKVHHVLLTVLDLCVLRSDGAATIDVTAACPDLLIEPWEARHARLGKLFTVALTRYKQLEDNCNKFKSLALPTPSTTVQFRATVEAQTVRYDLKRVMRLRQPWSGALLTALAQHQARAAFEHPFDHSIPTQQEANGDKEPEKDEASGATNHERPT